jgi:hypothetical protein
VRATREEFDVRGTGVVSALPPEGNDWHGFPYVRFDHDDKQRHVAETLLERIDVPSDDPRVDALEKAVAASKDRNEALRDLSNTLRAAEGE